MSSAASRHDAAFLGRHAEVARLELALFPPGRRRRRGCAAPIRFRVEVVVLDRAVLVRAGDAPRCGNWPLASCWPSERHRRAVSMRIGEADLALEFLVIGGVEVVDDGGGDVGVDVKGGRAGRPVSPSTPRRESSATRRPRPRGQGRPAVPPARCVEGHGPPAQCVPPRRTGACRSAPAARTPRCPRNVCPSYPVPVSPFAGIGRCSARAPACRIWKSPKPNGPAGSARHRRPRRPQPSQKASRNSRCSLSSPSQPVSSAAARAPKHLVHERGPRPLARPAVAEVLHHPQFRALRHLGGDREPPDVGERTLC